MLPVLSVVASAAFLKARGHATRKHDKEELQKLKEKEDRMKEALETVKRELEQEQALKLQVEEKLHVVESSVEELQGRTEALEQEKVDLRQQNTLLMLENVILSDTKVKLERKATELLNENEDLHNTVEALEEENEHAEAMLAKLKAAVGMIFDKYFSSEIDEQDAIRQVKDLGLEISVDVPTPRGRRKLPMATFSQATSMWEPKLILDNPERLQRLVAACMTPRTQTAAMPGSPNRLLSAGFPLLKDPTRPAITNSSNADAAPKAEAPAAAIEARKPSILVSSPVKTAPSKRPTIVSRLSLDQVQQGKQEKKQGSRWNLLGKGGDASSGGGAASDGGSKLDAKALQSLGSKMKDMNMDDLSAGMSKDVVLS